jgi:hypothetical protein
MLMSVFQIFILILLALSVTFLLALWLALHVWIPIFIATVVPRPLGYVLAFLVLLFLTSCTWALAVHASCSEANRTEQNTSHCIALGISK